MSYQQDEAFAKIYDLVCLLPNEPGSKVWYPQDGEEILCKTEQIAEGIADLFDALYGEPTVNTGFYDPEEDKRNGEVNDRTGYYYVTIE